MGQASRRGTFEERKAEAIARREEEQRISREAFLLRQAERDAELDRGYKPPYGTARKIGVVGSGGRGSRMMIMAAMLAATAGIGAIMPDDRKYR